MDYDPAWPGLFRKLCRQWHELLGNRIVDIDHVGSTAVPGLCAKPRIDAVIVVRGAADILPAARCLEAEGYRGRGDRYGDGMWAFMSGSNMLQQRIYLCLPDTPTHRRFVLFRDYLRTHPDVASAYGALKRELAVAYADDGDAYTRAKGDFIASVLLGASAEEHAHPAGAAT